MLWFGAVLAAWLLVEAGSVAVATAEPAAPLLDRLETYKQPRIAIEGLKYLMYGEALPLPSTARLADPIVVVAAAPTWVPASGGSLVELASRDDLPDIRLVCYMNGVAMSDAQRAGKRLVLCQLPPADELPDDPERRDVEKLPLTTTAEGRLDVGGVNGILSVDPTYIVYRSEPRQERVYPPVLDAAGGTQVQIEMTAPLLTETSGVQVRIGGAMCGDVTLFSPTMILCTAGAHRPSVARVRVSLNGYDVLAAASTAARTVTYVAEGSIIPTPPQQLPKPAPWHNMTRHMYDELDTNVTSVSPHWVQALVPAEVVLVGQGLTSESNSTTCRIGHRTPQPALEVADGFVVCPVPALHPDLMRVRIAISRDGIDFVDVGASLEVRAPTTAPLEPTPPPSERLGATSLPSVVEEHTTTLNDWRDGIVVQGLGPTVAAVNGAWVSGTANKSVCRDGTADEAAGPSLIDGAPTNLTASLDAAAPNLVPSWSVVFPAMDGAVVDSPEFDAVGEKPAADPGGGALSFVNETAMASLPRLPVDQHVPRVNGIEGIKPLLLSGSLLLQRESQAKASALASESDPYLPEASMLSLPAPVVAAVEPTTVAADDPSGRVAVTGHGFVNLTNHVACIFVGTSSEYQTSVATDAVFFGPELLSCATPNLGDDAVLAALLNTTTDLLTEGDRANTMVLAVEVTCNGGRNVSTSGVTVALVPGAGNATASTATTEFDEDLFYGDALAIVAVNPGLWPSNRETTLRVETSGMESHEEVQVRIRAFGVDSLDVPLQLQTAWYSGNELQVSVPPLPHGSWSLELAVAGREWTTRGSPALLVYDPIEVDYHLPVAGPAVGGTEVTLYGRNFANTTHLVCRFDGHPVPARFVSSTRVVCMAPPVDHTLHPLHWTTLVDLRHRDSSPLHGLPAVFPGAWNYPHVHVHSASLEVANNDQDYTDEGWQFVYQGDHRVTEVFPKAVRDEGNTPLFVLGSGFQNTTELRCRVGPAVVEATFISSSLVLCFGQGRSSIGPRQGVLRNGMLHVRGQAGMAWPAGAGHEFADGAVAYDSRSLGTMVVEVANNAQDYTFDRQTYDHIGPCPTGRFCPRGFGQGELVCPPGAFCPGTGNANFTMCPAGTYQPRPGQSACLRCPIGYFCPHQGMVVPRICPAGFVCGVTGSERAEQPCPEGHYCLEGTATTSTTCGNPFEASAELMPSLGHAEMTTTLRPDRKAEGHELTLGARQTGCFNNGTNDEGMVVSDKPLRFYDEAHLLPLAPEAEFSARRGRYCLDDRCMRLGSDSFEEAILSATDVAFDYSSQAYNLRRPLPCGAGVYCPAGTKSPQVDPSDSSGAQQCFESMHCPEGSGNPRGFGEVPPGFYSPFGVRLPCPAGTFCPRDGHWDPQPCPPGRFNGMVGQEECVDCPIGHICPGFGRVASTICPAGYVCSREGLATPNLQCPRGFYCNNGTQTVDPFRNDTTLRPMPCRPGTWCPAGTAFDRIKQGEPRYAQPCPSGYFCEAASNSPVGSGPCPPGFYCPEGTAVPIPTPQGHYTSRIGTVEPIKCMPGFYAPTIETTECYPCPPGTECDGTGYLIPVVCKPGFYRSILATDGVTCQGCPQGKWSKNWELRDKHECQTCAPGTVCKQEATTMPCSDEDLPLPYEPLPRSKMFRSDGSETAFGPRLCANQRDHYFGILRPPIDAKGRGPNLEIIDLASLSGSNMTAEDSLLELFPGSWCYYNPQPDGSLVYQRFKDYHGPTFEIQNETRHQGYSRGEYLGYFGFGSRWIDLAERQVYDPFNNCTPGFWAYDPAISADYWHPGNCEVDQFCHFSGRRQTIPCPRGYVCGAGTTHLSATEHPCPGGYYCGAATTPDASLHVPNGQYKLVCPAGDFCPKATAPDSVDGAGCPQGYFCPTGTFNPLLGSMAHDSVNRGLDNLVSDPWFALSNGSVYLPGQLTARRTSIHDERCFAAISDELQGKLRFEHNDRGQVGTFELALDEDSRCGRDHTWRINSDAEERRECDCTTQVRLAHAIYRLWACTERGYTHEQKKAGLGYVCEFNITSQHHPLGPGITLTDRDAARTPAFQRFEWRRSTTLRWGLSQWDESKFSSDVVAHDEHRQPLQPSISGYGLGASETFGVYGGAMDNRINPFQSPPQFVQLDHALYMPPPELGQELLRVVSDDALQAANQQGYWDASNTTATVRCAPRPGGVLDTSKAALSVCSFRELKEHVEERFQAELVRTDRPKLQGLPFRIDPFVYQAKYLIDLLDDVTDYDRRDRADDDPYQIGDELLRWFNLRVVPPQLTDGVLTAMQFRNWTTYLDAKERGTLPAPPVPQFDDDFRGSSAEVARATANILGWSSPRDWSEAIIEPTRRDACQCEQSLRCPNGTTSAVSSTSIWDCVAIGDEVLRRRSPIHPSLLKNATAHPRVIDLFEDRGGAGVVELRSLEQLTITMDLRDLPRNLTFPGHYRLAIYVDCMPCPPRYRCRTTQDPPTCVYPSYEEQVVHGYACEDCCRCQPREMPFWFQQNTVIEPFADDKHAFISLSVTALKDVDLFVAWELLHGQYVAAFDEVLAGATQAYVHVPQRAKYDEGETANRLAFLALVEREDWKDAGLALPLNMPTAWVTVGLGGVTEQRIVDDILIDRPAETRVAHPTYCAQRLTRELVNLQTTAHEILQAAELLATLSGEGNATTFASGGGRRLRRVSVDLKAATAGFSTHTKRIIRMLSGAPRTPAGAGGDGLLGFMRPDGDGAFDWVANQELAMGDDPQSNGTDTAAGAGVRPTRGSIAEWALEQFLSRFGISFEDWARATDYYWRQYGEVPDTTTLDDLLLIEGAIRWGRAMEFAGETGPEHWTLAEICTATFPSLPSPVVKGQYLPRYDRPATWRGLTNDLRDPLETVVAADSWFSTAADEELQYLFLPYLPFFSNCDGYDSHVLLSKLMEEHPDCKREPRATTQWVNQYPWMMMFQPTADECYDPSWRPGYEADSIPTPALPTVQNKRLPPGVAVRCKYEEAARAAPANFRWFEAPPGTVLFYITKNPISPHDFEADQQGTDKWGRTFLLNSLRRTENVVPVEVLRGERERFLVPGVVRLHLWYYQVSAGEKRIVRSFIEFDDYCSASPTKEGRQIALNRGIPLCPPGDAIYDYTLEVTMRPLAYIDLLNFFEYSLDVYTLLYSIIGILLVLSTFVMYWVHRIATRLSSTPRLRILELARILMPAPAFGVLLASAPVMTMVAFILSWLVQSGSENPVQNPSPYNFEGYDSDWAFRGVLDAARVALNTQGRVAAALLAAGFFIIILGASVLSPDEAAREDHEDDFFAPDPPDAFVIKPVVDGEGIETKAGDDGFVPLERAGEGRERREKDARATMDARLAAVLPIKDDEAIMHEDEIDFARHKLSMGSPKRDLWNPMAWRRSHIVFVSYAMLMLLLVVMEFSYSYTFQANQLMVIVIFKALQVFIELGLLLWIGEGLLVSPLIVALQLVEIVITMAAATLTDFVVAFFVEACAMLIERVYYDPWIKSVWVRWPLTKHRWQLWWARTLQWLMCRKRRKTSRAHRLRLQREEQVLVERIRTETMGVEPLLEAQVVWANETCALWLSPFVPLLLLMTDASMFHTLNITEIPRGFSIRETDLIFYSVFACMLIPFQLLADVIVAQVQELAHGWKLYELASFLHFRFWTRPRRWLIASGPLDHGVSERLQTIDASCLSSQFFFVASLHAWGMLLTILALTILLRKEEYNLLGDLVLGPIFILIWLVAMLLHRLSIFFANVMGLWQVRVIPGSHVDSDAALALAIGAGDHELMEQERLDLVAMNSETFRQRFIERNRMWIVKRLYELLTPRTLSKITDDGRLVKARVDDAYKALLRMDGNLPADVANMAEVQRSRQALMGDTAPTDEQPAWMRDAAPPTRAAARVARFWLEKARRRQMYLAQARAVMAEAFRPTCDACGHKRGDHSREISVKLARDGVPDELELNRLIELFEKVQHGREEDMQFMAWRAFLRSHGQFYMMCNICEEEDRSRRAELRRANEFGPGARAARQAALDSEKAAELDKYGELLPVLYDPLKVPRRSPAHRIMRKWLKATRKKLGGDFPRPHAKHEMSAFKAKERLARKRMADLRLQARRREAEEQRRLAESTDPVGATAACPEGVKPPDAVSPAAAALMRLWLSHGRTAKREKERQRCRRLLQAVKAAVGHMGPHQDWYYTSAMRIEGEELVADGEELDGQAAQAHTDAEKKVAGLRRRSMAERGRLQAAVDRAMDASLAPLLRRFRDAKVLEANAAIHEATQRAKAREQAGAGSQAEPLAREKDALLAAARDAAPTPEEMEKLRAEASQAPAVQIARRGLEEWASQEPKHMHAAEQGEVGRARLRASRMEREWIAKAAPWLERADRQIAALHEQEIKDIQAEREAERQRKIEEAKEKAKIEEHMGEVRERRKGRKLMKQMQLRTEPKQPKPAAAPTAAPTGVEEEPQPTLDTTKADRRRPGAQAPAMTAAEGGAAPPTSRRKALQRRRRARKRQQEQSKEPQQGAGEGSRATAAAGAAAANAE